MSTCRRELIVMGAALSLLVLLAGCGGPACVRGASQACACTSGASGAQTCQADGTFGACTCDGVDAGTGDASMDAGSPEDAGADDGGHGDTGPDDGGHDDTGPEDTGLGPDDSSTPLDAGRPPFTALSAGADFACALRREGTVACWGENASGQLGNGTMGAASTVPVDVVGVTDAVAIASGHYSTCVVRRGGGMQCWGVNTGGMFGFTSSPGIEPTAVEVPGVTDVRSIAVGSSHTCFVDSAGVGRCMGLNSVGQLGDGTRTDSAAPVRITGLRDIRQIAIQISGTCARLDAGTYCWGDNSYGTLGTGDFVSFYRPMATVVGLTDAVDVSAATAFGRWLCAARATGRVVCWGNNQYGMLLDGTVADSALPREIPGFTDAVLVREGVGHACALTGGGTVQCWGENFYGQLGDGSGDRAIFRVSVALPRPATDIALGMSFSCALDGVGVWCWGDDALGQLGDGATTTTRSLVPTPVSL